MSMPLYQPSALPFKPRKYQTTAIKFLLEHACAGLLLKPGLGKTASTLAAITFLKKRGLINKVLVIAPLRPCYTVWPREIKKWADFNHLTISVLHGPNKEAALREKTDIHVINPEGLDWLLDTTKSGSTTRVKVQVNVKAFQKLGYDVLVVDELSKFKHHSTGRFKALKSVLHTFGRRWGLTGSPASNGLMDLFGQAYVLDMGNALGPYITHFREQFFIPDRYGYNWTLKPGSADLIYEKLEPLMLQMGYEYLDMPELIENNIMVTLPPAAREVYDAIEDSFITAVENRLVTAANAAAASTKLRQIANGGVFLDSEIAASGLRISKKVRDWADVHSEKIAALRDLVDEMQGDPILVAYDFEHDLHRLRAAFKDGVFACDYNMKQFPELEAKWNRGEIPLLFGHPQSLGHGLNLQDNAQNVCWFALTWNRELYDQFIDRIWRQGNKFKQVFVHHIMSEGTIDEVMYGALNFKGSVEQALFDGIKKMAAERRSRA